MAPRPKRKTRPRARATAALDPSLPTLFTIGYSGHSPPSFVASLKAAKIARVLDVRSRPFSRKPGFSKGPMALWLREAGVEYVHLPALGAPPAVLDRKLAGEPFEDVEPAYRAHLAQQKGPTAEAAKLARENACVLVCLERDPSDCHRGILAERLGHMGFRIVHL